MCALTFCVFPSCFLCILVHPRESFRISLKIHCVSYAFLYISLVFLISSYIHKFSIDFACFPLCFRNRPYWKTMQIHSIFCVPLVYSYAPQCCAPQSSGILQNVFRAFLDQMIKFNKQTPNNRINRDSTTKQAFAKNGYSRALLS